MSDYQLAVIETISITMLAHFLMGSQMQLNQEKKKQTTINYHTYTLCEASTQFIGPQLTKHA